MNSFKSSARFTQRLPVSADELELQVEAFLMGQRGVVRSVSGVRLLMGPEDRDLALHTHSLARRLLGSTLSAERLAASPRGARDVREAYELRPRFSGCGPRSSAHGVSTSSPLS